MTEIKTEIIKAKFLINNISFNVNLLVNKFKSKVVINFPSTEIKFATEYSREKTFIFSSGDDTDKIFKCDFKKYYNVIRLETPLDSRYHIAHNKKWKLSDDKKCILDTKGNMIIYIYNVENYDSKICNQHTPIIDKDGNLKILIASFSIEYHTNMIDHNMQKLQDEGLLNTFISRIIQELRDKQQKDINIMNNEILSIIEPVTKLSDENKLLSITVKKQKEQIDALNNKIDKVMQRLIGLEGYMDLIEEDL